MKFMPKYYILRKPNLSRENPPVAVIEILEIGLYQID